MEILALVAGILIGAFAGILINSKRIKKGYAGTLVLDRSDPGSHPDIYLELNQEASFLEGLDSVSMDVRVIDIKSQK